MQFQQALEIEELRKQVTADKNKLTADKDKLTADKNKLQQEVASEDKLLNENSDQINKLKNQNPFLQGVKDSLKVTNPRFEP